MPTRTHLEEMLAQAISDHPSQHLESPQAPSSNLERNVEQPERHQSHAIGVLLIVRVEEGDEDAEEFLNGGEGEGSRRQVICGREQQDGVSGALEMKRERQNVPSSNSPSSKASSSCAALSPSPAAGM